ncbi:AAA family ATPase, partial [Shewanella sp. 0m-11]
AARGIPRLINVLSHKALLVAFGEGRSKIERHHVDAAIADTSDATNNQGLAVKWAIALAVITGISVSLFYWFKGGVI